MKKAKAGSKSDDDGSSGGSGGDMPASKHKQMAILLIKERNKLIERLVQLQHRNTQVEQTLKQVKACVDVCVNWVCVNWGLCVHLGVA